MSHAFTQVTSKRAAHVATPLDILFVLVAVHPFAWLLAVFWVCSLLSVLGGFASKQRVPPVSIDEAAKEDG